MTNTQDTQWVRVYIDKGNGMVPQGYAQVKHITYMSNQTTYAEDTNEKEMDMCEIKLDNNPFCTATYITKEDYNKILGR